MTTRTSDSKVLQNISYTYDPTGNITLVNDSSIATVFSNNQQVEPKQKFTYDALYRLTEAEGREHTALNNPDYYKDTNAFKQSSFISITDANDSNRLANYTRRYTYDKAGNMLTVQHIAANSARSFTRTIRVDEESNRWLPANMGNNLTIGNYYDANGNIKELETLQELNWNYRDNISSGITVQRPGGISDGEFYMYDAAGQRVRKKYRQVINAFSTRYTEKVYVGNVEVKRIRTYTTGSGYTTTLRRTTLNIMDDARRIARVYNWTIDTNLSEVNSSNELYTNMIHYQYGNHLDSASLELSDQGQIISYEEYFPYGDTSFIAGNSQKGVKIKDYRFTGKEKDDVTGLYYYGARYYASWLGRWMSADPLFRENASVYDRPKGKDVEEQKQLDAEYMQKLYNEGLNLYGYVKGNPVRFRDPSGREGEFSFGMGCNSEKKKNENETKKQEEIIMFTNMLNDPQMHKQIEKMRKETNESKFNYGLSYNQKPNIQQREFFIWIYKNTDNNKNDYLFLYDGTPTLIREPDDMYIYGIPGMNLPKTDPGKTVNKGKLSYILIGTAHTHPNKDTIQLETSTEDYSDPPWGANLDSYGFIMIIGEKEGVYIETDNGIYLFTKNKNGKYELSTNAYKNKP